MSSQSLTARLQALADTYKATLVLIQQMQEPPSDVNGPDARPQSDLASEIHESLKEQEDTLELLRQEDDSSHYAANSSRWVGAVPGTRGQGNEREPDHQRNAATIARLSEDLKSARGAFRRAQLQTKRNADSARRRERELLFANRASDSEHLVPGRRKGMEKLTQDELALNASSDVTAALRRTHELMQGNIQQSQFAQQTLDESSAALASLSESYGGVGDLLKGSKGLVGQLLRSQKSDTWYLETSFYLLCLVIGWLVFRRLLYGPLWWFAWQPLKLVWWLFMSSLGFVGITGAVSNSVAVPSSTARSPGLNANGVPTNIHGRSPRSMYVGGKGGGWDRPLEPPTGDDSMVEKIGRLAENLNVQDGLGEPGIDLDGVSETIVQPPNTMKRMWEEEQVRDEL